MSETTELLDSPPAEGSARAKGLSSMVLPDLKAMASKLGIKGTSAMRKGDLVAAIAARQSGESRSESANSRTTPQQPPLPDVGAEATAGAGPADAGQADAGQAPRVRTRRSASRDAGAPTRSENGAPDAAATDSVSAPSPEQPSRDLPSHDQVAGDQAANGRAPRDRSNGSNAGGPSEAAAAVHELINGTDRSGADSRSGADTSTGDNERTAGDRTNGSAQGGGNGSDGDSGTANGTDEFTGRERNRRNRRNRRDRGDRSFDNDTADGADRSANQPQRTQPNNGQANGSTNGSNGGSNGATSGANGGSSNGSATQDRPARDSNRDAPNRDSNRDAPNRDSNRDAQNRDSNRAAPNRDSGPDDDLDGDGNRRGRRYRDRNRRGRERFADTPADTEVRDDDVLLPVAGILDVLDSYAFVRTSGYLTGSNDVYVSLSQVRKYGLRRGDAVTGAVRAPRENEAARQKFNALVRLDSVNGLDPEQARHRPEFTKLTPLYPNERLRLETEPHILTTRVIDLVMPVGKGQRALIVSPPKAGKTSVLQAIANAISTNNPECHLMVVLVDERPEEVTDMQRSVKGEVIASTFDRPPADHTQLAELAIERAKRLVEMGKDVVVLLDSITRLGRAYNLAAPASGRILSGGVDSTALFPPKRFLGAARNIENGGSLTIFASALVETGSAGDTVIFEEFKGTGNAELKLDRRIADKRVFPAIDIDQSSTRKEDLLMSPDEHAVVIKLRRVLGALEAQPALDLVLERLRKTRSNIEFLMQVAATTPNADRDR